MGILCVPLRVRHHHDGCPLLVQLRQEPHHLDAVLGIQITGRLIGKDQLRVGDQRPGDRHTLLLTSGELLGKVLGAMPHVHTAQHLLHSLFALSRRDIQVGQRQLHVLIDVQLVDQVEALEDEANLSLADGIALLLAQVGHLLSHQAVGATRRVV